MQGVLRYFEDESESVSQWVLLLMGAPVHGGHSETVTALVTSTEFANLGDPIIVGMPTIDRYGGLEVMRNFRWLVGVWVPRFCPVETRSW